MQKEKKILVSKFNFFLKIKLIFSALSVLIVLGIVFEAFSNKKKDLQLEIHN